MAGLLENMIKEGIITRFDGGPETVYGIAEGRADCEFLPQHDCAFLARAVAELALLAVSEQPEHPALSLYSGKCRNCVTVQVRIFLSRYKKNEQDIDAELSRENLNGTTGKGANNARLIINRMSPKVGHVTFSIFAELQRWDRPVSASPPERGYR